MMKNSIVAPSLTICAVKPLYRNPTLLALLGALCVFVAFLLLWQSFAAPVLDSYKLTGRFADISGLKEGDRISFGGVNVGSVGAVSLDKETLEAIITLAINTDVAIPDDSILTIQSLDVLGRRALRIVPGYSPVAFAQGDEFLLTQGATDVSALLLNAIDQ